MKTLLLIIVSLISFSFTGLGQYHDSILTQHHFKNEIIRSYDVKKNKETNNILIGMKGDALESGKVLLSEDDGITWKPLNQDKALCDSCIDIQCVKFVSEDILLAGSWQNGLYRSSDKGESFNRLLDFPANDIRSITSDAQNNIYAATTSHGIMKSVDEGLTWNSTHSDSLNRQMAAWHIAVNPFKNEQLYACTFGQDLKRSLDQGKTWTSVSTSPGIMFFDIAFTDDVIYAIAASDSASFIYSSVDKGDNWIGYKLDINSGCAIEVVEDYNNHHVLIGTWTSGMYRYFPLQKGSNEFLKDQAHYIDSVGVTKIYSDGLTTHKFTWGDGYKKYERQKGCFFDLPNVLTPDCDRHPCFEAAIDCEIENFHFIMYDRWGEIVLENEEGIASFDDAMNEMMGKNPDGVYVYWIRGKFVESGTPIDYKGHITLLR